MSGRWQGAAPDALLALCSFEKVDQLKQEMRRKKELERRLRVGDASKDDEDAAEPDAVSDSSAHPAAHVRLQL